jgi:two-component system chemotaxis response regulator CheY
MTNTDSERALRTARAQAAVVRTLTSELKREGHETDGAEGLRAQAVEESARLSSALEGLSRARRAIRAPLDTRPKPCLPLERQRPRVLVVEDDDASRAVLVEALGVEFEVTEAVNGAQGLKAATERTFDALVTDVRMPEMDGITMAERIAGVRGSPLLPVIFLTAETAPERIAAGFSAGATSYMVKPVDLDLLEEELRWLLGVSSP